MGISSILKILFGLSLLVLSLYYFIYGLIYVLRQRLAMKKNGEKAIATIIDYKTYTDLDGCTSYVPIIRFTDKTGRLITVEAETGKPDKHNNDKKLYVYYLPSDPHQFYIEHSIPFQVYLLPFAIPVIAIAIYIIIKTIELSVIT